MVDPLFGAVNYWLVYKLTQNFAYFPERYHSNFFACTEFLTFFFHI